MKIKSLKFHSNTQFDTLMIGLLYSLIYICLLYFIYPVEDTATVSKVLGEAFFIGTFSGIFSGIIGGLWVNRIDRKKPIAAGVVAGFFSIVIGSILFPFVGAIVRQIYFQDPYFVLVREISFLFNLSIVSLGPAVFVSIIAGGLGAILTNEIGTVN